MHQPTTTQCCTLGGGCFWCLDSLFSPINGVVSVTCGYAGGTADTAAYSQVCSGTTGHAEVVQLVFDPQRIGFETLLQLFFAAHDPTTLNRQGADMGTQYRSVIFYHTPEQQQYSLAAIERLTHQGIWAQPIVTQVAPLLKFYPAEDYHQHYAERVPNNPYCQTVIQPKLNSWLKQHAELIAQDAHP